jgi:formamidopyrimidine-DNA glycosylase
MPELPEVETIRRGLKNLAGKKVKNIFRSEKKLRISSTLDLQNLQGLKIKNIDRRARYLILNFSKDKSLIIHLGMSGRVTLEKNFKQLKHDHFVIEFADDLFLVFNDPRRFGFVDLVSTKNLDQHKMLAKLGVEPLSDDFNFTYLAKKLSRKKKNIKSVMMDNEIVVGVGNIYISESLFDAKISPLRESSSIRITEIKKLVSAIKKTIEKAIELGGSSINDYVDSAGNLGNFQKNFKVYGRTMEKCLLCKNLIRKIVQSGRSSFYCPNCQK